MLYNANFFYILLTFFLILCLKFLQIEKLLKQGGAVRDHYLSEMITYVIVDDAAEPEFTEAKELFELKCVSVCHVFICTWILTLLCS